MTARPAFPSAADSVVIGGGAIGSSIAFHLAEAGAGEIVLLERDQLASGSTSKASGGIRAQFSTPANIALSTLSIKRFAEFETRPGANIDFAQNGYLFVLSRQEDVDAFKHSIILQAQYGVESRLLTVKEIHDLVPFLNLDGILAGAYCATDGSVTPEAVVQGYASGARRHGAQILTQCPVDTIETSGGHITGVSTPRGSISTPRVICAAGAWASEIGAMAGVDLPVRPQRQQIVYTEQISGLPPNLPTIVDFATGLYVHQDGASLLLGRADPDEPSGVSTHRSDDWLPYLYAAVTQRLPMLDDIGLRGGWAGLYELTADHHPVIGHSTTVGGFYFAAGFSGHGLMHAPAIGEIVRDLVLGMPPVIDMSPFALERFERGELLHESNAI